MKSEIAALRREYASHSLLEKDVDADPIRQFEIWWIQAIESEIVEPNSMVLATASPEGVPSARVVLLKGFDHRGFVFFTNYKSAKAVQLQENPKACIVFYWKELERQVRITGLVSKVSEEESRSYFNSRPEGSKIGAWASPQSHVIESREWLDQQYEKLSAQWMNAGIDKPEFWGGYIVTPVQMEFWQGRPSRLHDRLQYTLGGDGVWKIERLAP